jgi:GDPmannose 4,6-dehydratase
MEMKALIFGINGQDGYYLKQVCEQKQIKVVGVSRSNGNWIQGSVGDWDFVDRVTETHQPDFVFHLAANSTTRHDALLENHETISTGALNVLEAVKRHCPDTKVFITGSGVQFKNAGNPISESDEFEPKSAYSVARIQSVYAARYFRTLGIKVYVGYLFHHESPMRKPEHLSKLIASTVQRIKQGTNEVIEIGDLSVKKELTFAGDVVRGILTLVEQNDVFEAVIGSGIAYSVEDWLQECFAYIGKDWHDYVRLRDGFKAEYGTLFSNPSTINRLGWHPTVDLKALAKMMVAQSGYVMNPKIGAN